MVDIEQKAGVDQEHVGLVESGNQFLENDSVSAILVNLMRNISNFVFYS